MKAFRDTWELGIHSYLTYLRDRLTVARDLLTDTGSIFVQIGDENVHLVRCLMDEVFGSENFVVQISFKKTGFQSSVLLPSNFDFIVWYAKNREDVKFRQLHISKLTSSAFVGQDLWIELTRWPASAGWDWPRVMTSNPNSPPGVCSDTNWRNRLVRLRFANHSTLRGGHWNRRPASIGPTSVERMPQAWES